MTKQLQRKKYSKLTQTKSSKLNQRYQSCLNELKKKGNIQNIFKSAETTTTCFLKMP